ncbi:2865_t:CDS:1, partial [Cetraspora pellucida]
TDTEADIEEIIKINTKEIIEVNQETGKRNHIEQNFKKIVKKGLIESNHKAY